MEGYEEVVLEKVLPFFTSYVDQKGIYGITATDGESLHEYWELFKSLCASFSHHQIYDVFLIQYFYEGLVSSDRSTIDATTGVPLLWSNLIYMLTFMLLFFQTNFLIMREMRRKKMSILKLLGWCLQAPWRRVVFSGSRRRKSLRLIEPQWSY